MEEFDDKRTASDGGCLTLAAIWTFIAVVAVAVFCFLNSCNSGLKREIEQLREELAKQQQYMPLMRDTIRDSVEVITQKIVTVEKIKEVLTNDDKQLIKDLGLKVKELEALQKTGMVTHDTVWLEKADSTKDSPLVYHDAWADFEYKDKLLKYSVRDSLAIALKKEYKKKFLWWKWGTKGYEVKAVNMNPHSTIRYNTYVRRGE